MLLVNPFLGVLALKRLEKKAGSAIQGAFLPDFVFPAFTLRNARFRWEDRFEVRSGTLRVHYRPFVPFPGWKLRSRIEGRDLDVGLSGKLAESQGISQVHVKQVTADLALGDEGDPEIFLFDIRSREIQFRLIKESASKTVN